MNEETFNETFQRLLGNNLHLQERLTRYRRERENTRNQYQVLHNQYQQQLNQNHNLRNQVNQLLQQLGNQNMAQALQTQIVKENGATYKELLPQVRKFNNPELKGNIPTFGGEIYEVLRYITEIKNCLRGNNIDLERFDAPGLLEHNPGIIQGTTNCTIENDTTVSHAACIAPAAQDETYFPATLNAAIVNARPSHEGVRIIAGKLVGNLADLANTFSTKTTIYSNEGTNCRRMQKIVNQMATGLTGEAAEWWNSLTDATRPRTFNDYQFNGAGAAIGFFSAIRGKFLPAHTETDLYKKWKQLTYANYPLKDDERRNVRDFLRIYELYSIKGNVQVGNDTNKIQELIERFNKQNNFERKIIEGGRLWLGRQRADNNNITYEGFKMAIETYETEVVNPDRTYNIIGYKGSREQEYSQNRKQWRERDEQGRYVRGRSPVYSNEGFTTRTSRPLSRRRSREQIHEVTANGRFSMGQNRKGNYGGNFKARIQGCFNCGEEGHYIRECPHKKGNESYTQKSKYMRRDYNNSKKQNEREDNNDKRRAQVRFNTKYNSRSNYRTPSRSRSRDNQGRFTREVKEIQRIPPSRRITSIEDDFENLEIDDYTEE